MSSFAVLKELCSARAWNRRSTEVGLELGSWGVKQHAVLRSAARAVLRLEEAHGQVGGSKTEQWLVGGGTSDVWSD